MDPLYLFSIDLEDVRFAMADGRKRRERVPEMVGFYLDWLRERGAKTTFFVVGDVAEAYPDLIASIAAEGHEIGCHSYRHVHVHEQTPAEFRADLEASLAALRRAGVSDVRGYRAPVFTLTAKTAWAYPILRDLGFTYSTSVLPAKNPFWSWPEFGPAPRKMDGVWEIPMTVARLGHLVVPPAGGVYLRALPLWFIKRAARRARKAGRPLLGYCHPYDIDTGQERFMHPDIDDSRFYNFLMYWNRGKVFKRLEAILAQGFRMVPYRDYAATLTPSS
jgi:polysaccharide deacetylase family protein (PEP-CTERM system associated)